MRALLSNMDPVAAARAITSLDPETLNKVIRGNVDTQTVGKLLTTYAGVQTGGDREQWAATLGNILGEQQTTAELAQAAGTIVGKVPNEQKSAQVAGAILGNVPQLKAQMPQQYISFSEQVQAAFKDLETYPDHKVKLLAKHMKLHDCNNRHKKELCLEIARKLIYSNSRELPFTDKRKCSRYTKKLSEKELTSIRNKVYRKFVSFKDSVYTMSSKDLHDVFSLYDKLCFDGDIESYVRDANFTLKFRTSGEDTFTTEGICTQKICDYIVTIPTHYFKNVNGITNVAGHLCKDQLECLLRVMEHELVHLIIFMFCGDPFITDQHGTLFMNIVKDLFGHTDFRHYIF